MSKLTAKDLRVGNWADLNGNHREIDAKHIVSQSQCDVSGIEFFKPIPLTAEWLERAGFDDDGEINCKSIGPDMLPRQRFLFVNIDNNSASLYEDDNHGGFEVKIEFVHQLQNLYHALTGEELKLEGNENR